MLVGAPADPAELGLRDAVRLAQAGAELAGDDPRVRPLELLRARRGRQFSEWDGNVAAVDGELLFGADRAVSPTSLEAYGTCGYRYFARSVLRLNVVAEPDEREIMDPAERGSVIHRVLERFFREKQAEGRPRPGETWTESDEVRLLQIAGEALERASERGQTGLAVYAQHDFRQILTDLRYFLKADDAQRAATGAVPSEFEIAIPERTVAGVTLRGRVDRIDRTPDGREAWVIDYKTGSTWDVKDSVTTEGFLRLDGKKLQLPAYLAAAADAETARAMYWYITRKGEFSRVIYPENEASQAQFEAILQAIVGGIRAGSFPAVPDEEDEWKGGFKNCKYCDFDRICSRRRDLEYAAKAGEGDLAWHGVAAAAAGETDDD
jgi:CRISPR/Cas system-associated exonuclease Cas4 (RecB family)